MKLVNRKFCLVISLVAGLLLVPGRTEGEAMNLEEGVASLAAGLAASSSNAGQPMKVAVLEFGTVSGFESALGLFLAEELVTALATLKPPVFQVVERSQLSRVLAEQELGESALLDPESVARVGGILGLEGVVTGTLADLGSEVRVNARLISVETASIQGAASASFKTEGNVEHLLRQSASRGGPSERRSDSPRLSQASDVFFENDFIRATVESAGRDERGLVVTIALQLENLLSEELFLAGVGRHGGCVFDLVDDRGNSSYAYGSDVRGISCIYDNRGRKYAEEQYYTRLAPRSRTTLVLSMKQNSGWTGERFSLSGQLLRFFSGGRWERFSMGFANIRLAN